MVIYSNPSIRITFEVFIGNNKMENPLISMILGFKVLYFFLVLFLDVFFSG
jgi:hypothetical protein